LVAAAVLGLWLSVEELEPWDGMGHREPALGRNGHRENEACLLVGL
jgi:hypothetical protein